MRTKIHIIGGPGSGKSYIAKIVSEKLAIPHLDLDDIFWDKSLGYGNKADEETRNAELEHFLAQPTWIVEGVYYKWLNKSFEQADLIVVLNTSVWLRHWRLIKRSVRRKLGRENSNVREVKDETVDSGHGRGLPRPLRLRHWRT